MLISTSPHLEQRLGRKQQSTREHPQALQQAHATQRENLKATTELVRAVSWVVTFGLREMAHSSLIVSRQSMDYTVIDRQSSNVLEVLIQE